MPFETGLKALDEAINASNQDRGFGAKLNYISWKDGERKILRFLTNEPISGDFAEWVNTNDEKIKTQDFLIEPGGTNWVTEFGGRSREYGTGNLIVPRLRKLGVCIAVLRDEQPLQNGRTEIVDAKHQVTVDGKTYPARYFGIVKQSPGNFWQHFQGISHRYGTICDRDYEITRRGGDKNTKYDVAPIDPIDELRELEALQTHYGYGRKFDEQDPDRYLYCPQTLLQWADYYSGEERARHWLLPKENQAPGGTVTYSSANVSGSAGGGGAGSAGGSGLSEFSHGTTSNPDVWGRSEDEAQAAPSASTKWAGLKDSLMPHLGKDRPTV